MPLIVTHNLPDHDDFYAELLAAHDDMSAEDITAFHARLILILANHIGDRQALSEALALAKK